MEEQQWATGEVSANDRSDEFMRLLTEHDRGVFLFILSLVPNWADAEEVHQETNVSSGKSSASFSRAAILASRPEPSPATKY